MTPKSELSTYYFGKLVFYLSLFSVFLSAISFEIDAIFIELIIWNYNIYRIISTIWLCVILLLL